MKDIRLSPSHSHCHSHCLSHCPSHSHCSSHCPSHCQSKQYLGVATQCYSVLLSATSATSELLLLVIEVSLEL